MNQSISARSWALLLLLSFLWGGSFIFNRIALDDFDPLTVVCGRVTIAALALHTLIRIRGLDLPVESGVWRSWFVMGLLNNVAPFTLIVWGQTQISSGQASILNATTPLFSIVIAHLVSTEETLTANRVMGVVLGIAGVSVLVGPALIASAGESTWGKVACLAASLSYACAGLWGRRLRNQPALFNAAGQVTCSAAVMLVLAFAIDQPWQLPAPSGESLLAIAGLGIVSTAIGYLIYFRLLATAGATNTLLVTLLIPVSALLMASLVLDERVHAIDLVGMTLIGLGLLAVDGRTFPALRRRLMQSDLLSDSV